MNGGSGIAAALGTLTLVAAVWLVPNGIARSALLEKESGTAPSIGSTLTAQIVNTPYTADFTFVRIRYEMGGLSSFGREPPWAHDYPRAERNFARLLDETTLMEPYLGGSNIFATDDPEIFRYPIAYMSEPGFWSPSQEEAEGLRNWLLKGGFLIFDDFGGPRDWVQMEQSLRRVLPNHEIHPIDLTHDIFDSFFRIESLDFGQAEDQSGGFGRRGRGGGGPGYRGVPEYFGITENNEPDGRLLAVINYNNDIGDYWEWSDEGYLPVSLTNEAYKLGINYVVYAMTH